MSLSHRQLAACYLQLSQQLGAGMTFLQALQTPSPIPAGERRRLAELIAAGHPMAKVFGAAGGWLPETDRPFLIAAADSGRLPLVLQAMSERHDHLGKLRGRVILACLYPVGVLHFGALVFAFFRLIDWERGIQWDPLRFLLGIAMILGPFWLGAVLLTTLVRRRNPLALGFLNLLPAIGGYRRNQALADFSFALGQLLTAGTPIGAAWQSAGGVANSPRIARAATAIAADIARRETPGTHLGEHRVFPSEFTAVYRTGEVTGSLEQSLLHLSGVYQERARQRLAFAAALYPGLLFFAVAGLVLYIVVSFYAGYIGGILKMIDGG